MSSMSPIIVINRKTDEVDLVIGASGGAKIISGVAYVAARALWMNETMKQAMDAPRIYNQLVPNVVEYEREFNDVLVKRITDIGHVVKTVMGRSTVITAIQRTQQANNQSILYANSDYRKGTTSYTAGYL